MLGIALEVAAKKTILTKIKNGGIVSFNGFALVWSTLLFKQGSPKLAGLCRST